MSSGIDPQCVGEVEHAYRAVVSKVATNSKGEVVITATIYNPDVRDALEMVFGQGQLLHFAVSPYDFGGGEDDDFWQQLLAEEEADHSN